MFIPVLYVLTFLLSLIIIILVVPVNVYLLASGKNFDVRLRWLVFNAYYSKLSKTKFFKEKFGKKPDKKEKLKDFSLKSVKEMLEKNKLLIRLGKAFLKALHIDGFAEGVLGLKNPAHTGYFTAVMSILRGFGLKLYIQPDFQKEIFDVSATLHVWVFPISIIKNYFLRRD